MKTILIIAVLLIAAFVLFTYVKRRQQPDDDGQTTGMPTFSATGPLTKIEQIFFNRLTEAMPDCIVLAQVALNQLVDVKSPDRSTYRIWKNKVERKSVDFLICRKDLTVIAAIELDDASHQRKDRLKADADKDAALLGAGYKIIRWPVKPLPDVTLIRETMHG